MFACEYVVVSPPQLLSDLFMSARLSSSKAVLDFPYICLLLLEVFPHLSHDVSNESVTNE